MEANIAQLTIIIKMSKLNKNRFTYLINELKCDKVLQNVITDDQIFGNRELESKTMKILFQFVHVFYLPINSRLSVSTW